MTPGKITAAAVLGLAMAVILSCGGGSKGTTATATSAEVYNRYGWAVDVPAGATVVEKGLGSDKANENLGRIEWGDAFKSGLVSILWILNANRDNYKVSTGIESVSRDIYVEQPVVTVSNMSAIQRGSAGGFDIDYKTYDMSYFSNALQGVTTAHQCNQPDQLFFVNVIAKEQPLQKAEQIIAGFKCSK